MRNVTDGYYIATVNPNGSAGSGVSAYSYGISIISDWPIQMKIAFHQYELFLMRLSAIALALSGCVSCGFRERSIGFHPEPEITPYPTSKSYQPTLPLVEKWCIREEFPISKPLYSQGLVITSDDGYPRTTHHVYDAVTANIVWSSSTPNKEAGVGISGFGLVYGNWYIVGDGTSISVFKTRSGEIAWQKAVLTNTGMDVGDDMLFVSTHEAILAYDLETGNILWQSPGQGRWASAPLYDPTDQVVIISQQSYQVLDSKTGEVLKDAPSLPDGEFGDYFDEAQVYQGAIFERDRKVDIMTGEILHEKSACYCSQNGKPYIIDQYMLLSDMEDIVSVDLDTLEILWRYHAPAVDENQLLVLGDPIALDGVVYTILSDASIRALDLMTGSEIGMWQGKEVVDRRGITTPLVPGFAVGDGMLFAAFGTNELCAFGK